MTCSDLCVRACAYVCSYNFDWRLNIGTLYSVAIVWKDPINGNSSTFQPNTMLVQCFQPLDRLLISFSVGNHFLFDQIYKFFFSIIFYLIKFKSFFFYYFLFDQIYIFFHYFLFDQIYKFFFYYFLFDQIYKFFIYNFSFVQIYQFFSLLNFSSFFLFSFI